MVQENESWNWVNHEETNNGITTDRTEYFKAEIDKLQNEKQDLIAQLEQLDSDNQQNVGKLMEVKHNLQSELNKTKESYSELEQLYNICLAKEKSFQTEISNICINNENELVKQKAIQEELKDKYDKLYDEFQKVSDALTENENKLNAKSDNQENCHLIEIGKLQDELAKYKEEIENIEGFNKKEVAKQKEIEDLLRNENEKILDELQHVKAKLAETNTIIETVTKTSVQERERFLKELEQSRSSYSLLEKLHEEELNNCKKNYEERLFKLMESENALLSKYQILMEEYERIKQNVTEVEKLQCFQLVSKENGFVGNEEKNIKTNCEELTDCDLGDSSFDNDCSSSPVDAYSIVKGLFESYNKTLTGLSKVVNSLDLPNKPTKLQEIEGELKSLGIQVQSLLEQNELIHSKYCSSESFKVQIDSVILASLKESSDTLKKELESEIVNREKYLQVQTKEMVHFTEKIRKSFEDFKNSTNPPEYQLFTTKNNEIIELDNLFKEMYSVMYELKSKVILLSDSNINIISEKNQEIERLLEKTDQLTQDILEKSQTLKEYENEITELSKNNDLLIADLEVYKNNHLETISEIDEDKTVLLEEQLEYAQAQIKQLQSQLATIQEDKQSRMEISDSKIEEEDNTYLELLNKYDELQVEYDVIKRDYVNIENDFQALVEENNVLKSSVESLKANSEHQLYIQDELKILNESLQFDVEMYKEKLDNLVNISNKLKIAGEENEDLKKQITSIEEKLSKEEQIRNDLQTEISELTEKLKLSKMTETSLKLQYDTLSKEFTISVDTNKKLEDNLNKVQSMIISCQKECEDLKIKNEEKDRENKKLEEIVKNQEERIQTTKELVENLEQKLLEHTTDQELQNSNNTKKLSLTENSQEENKMVELEQENSELKKQLEALKNSQSELIQLVTTKHQENIAYHTEIQRLNQILNNESQKSRDFETKINNLQTTLSTENQEKQTVIEKLKEENVNLKEQCELLSQSILDEKSKFTRLLEEKSSSSEAEISLKKKLERLQTHLIELEEHYTSELYEAEQKNFALQAKVNEIEEREKSSSTMYTSVSIRANQQVESLQNQLQTITNERDSLRKQISDLEDTINKQTAALTNLQLVLEQFRKDKEKEVHKETERLRRQINAEKKVQDTLKNEISTLKSQLEESKQGLLAASRLSDQLENSRSTISTLKEEVSKLQSNLALKQEELNMALSQTDGKVDKSLIKNLVIGFVTCNNNLSKDQTQILKIIGTVLDFNQQDHDKLKLNKGLQGSWLGGLLSPQSNFQNAGQESLSRAFIEFLEKESKPRVVPSLLNANEGTPKPSSSRSSTPGQSPANLSEIVLPTFADFAQNRNSSSILKDVLKDHS